jgi:hypothetical protein
MNVSAAWLTALATLWMAATDYASLLTTLWP